MERVGIDRKDNTHKAILNAALTLFSKKGYSDTSVREISELAGCNTLTVFRHFENKEKLLCGVVDQYKDINILPGELDFSIGPERLHEDLRSLSDLYFKIIFRNKDIIRIFISDGVAFPSIQPDVWTICPVLREHMSRSLADIGAANSPEIAEMFVSYITKLCLEFINHENIRAYSEDVARLFNIKMEPQIDFICEIIMMSINNRDNT